MHMSEDAFLGLVGVLRPHLPPRGVSAECCTDLPLRYLGGGSYVDICDVFSRKGFYVLNVQAICDAEYKFRWMSCKSPGSAHDSTAFSCDSLGQALHRADDPLTLSLIQHGHCIACDEDCAESEVLAVPWPGGCKVDLWRDSYNFHSSSLRIHIEQNFKVLV